jgi:hypothetical protein
LAKYRFRTVSLYCLAGINPLAGGVQQNDGAVVKTGDPRPASGSIVNLAEEGSSAAADDKVEIQEDAWYFCRGARVLAAESR